MTEQEAMTIIKCEKEHHSEYSVIGEALQIAIQAIEKQIPKKVIFVHSLQEDDVGDYMCPTCKSGTVYNAYGDKSWHCPYCGQAIDWSDYD